MVIKIDMPTLAEPIRVVSNEVDVDWTDPDTAGVESWTAFPFEIDDVGEPSRGELPQVILKISNITRAVQGYVDQASGGVDADVTIFVVTLAETTPYLRLDFRVSSTTCDDEWVTFRLTSADMWRQLAPKNKCLKNNCSYRFKDVFCAYSGGETDCNHTFARCREIGNQARFGGFPSIGFTGIKI